MITSFFHFDREGDDEDDLIANIFGDSDDEEEEFEVIC